MLLDAYLGRVDEITSMRAVFQVDAAPAIQRLLCDANLDFIADKLSIDEQGALHAYVRAHGYVICGTIRRDPKQAYTVGNGAGYVCLGVIDGLTERSPGVSEVVFPQ